MLTCPLCNEWATGQDLTKLREECFDMEADPHPHLWVKAKPSPPFRIVGSDSISGEGLPRVVDNATGETMGDFITMADARDHIAYLTERSEVSR